MIKTNPLLAHYSLVRERAAMLGCTVHAVLGNLVLCCRKSDDTYITWRAAVYNNNQVEFISGCYDMDSTAGHINLIERCSNTFKVGDKFKVNFSSAKPHIVRDCTEGTHYTVLATDGNTARAIGEHDVIFKDDVGDEVRLWVEHAILVPALLCYG